MKKIIVLSDTHGNRAAMEKLNPLFEESDYIIHLGDTSTDGAVIKNFYPDKTYLLNGNCDMAKHGRNEMTIEIEGVRIFACHGDAYGVKNGYERIVSKAKQEDCSIVLFGHTHRPAEIKAGDIKMFNPGTLSRFAANNTYLYLVIADGKAVGKIVALQ